MPSMQLSPIMTKQQQQQIDEWRIKSYILKGTVPQAKLSPFYSIA